MTDTEAALEEVRRALRREPRLNFDHQPISLTFANGELLLSAKSATSWPRAWRSSALPGCRR